MEHNSGELLPGLHPYQVQANEIHLGWARDHEKDSQKGGGKITVIEFDPVRYPEQLIENAIVEISQDYKLAHPQVVLSRLRENIGRAMRSEVTANRFIRELKAAPTSPANPVPLVESIKLALSQNQSVAVLFGHQILMDEGYGLAGLAAAQGTTEYMDRNVAILNKTMAFEKFEGVPFVELSKPFSNAVFVSPKTSSSEARNIPDEISGAINRPALRAISEFGKKGALFTVALHGTALRLNQNGDYVMEALDSAAAGLIEKCSYILRLAMHKNPDTSELTWDISPLEKLEAPEGNSKHQRREGYRRAAETAQELLARQMEALSGRNVINEQTKNRSALGAAALSPVIDA
jgi:hypothetical protein